ncbi:hypothetical protein MLD38_004580 [Melastoma candidum]|uniref:Uncharacterized protein n=1 Tax=Melastoma candidum TaxID=119954 RepID=A0ACB9S819_9MYRT|nr:hypothetical protein MLD38_004580 [Melastoma candidum]
MGAIKLAVADAALTFTWVFFSSTLGAATAVVASRLGLGDDVFPFASLLVATVLLFALLFVFDLLGAALDGASFNPTSNASLYAAGVGGDDLFSMALRFPAQAAGAVGGALAIVEVVPKQSKHMLAGPLVKVDLQTGAIAEGVLTFTITVVVLYIILKGPKNTIARNFLLSLVTVPLVIAGSSYTGPSMNPANAFGWAYVKKQHDTWEQLYVYWIAPFVGAILAAWVFRVIFPPPVGSQERRGIRKRRRGLKDLLSLFPLWIRLGKNWFSLSWKKKKQSKGGGRVLFCQFA